MSPSSTPVLLLCVALVAASCVRPVDGQDQGDSARPGDVLDQVPDNGIDRYTAPDPAAQLELLRQELPEANEGDDCATDQGCFSPLRCVDATCVYPSAMTGAADEHTPAVVFMTETGPVRYFAELTATPPEHARGLMDRPWMVEEWSMLFIFPTEQPRSFWMRNTLIPLDMVFVRGDGVVDSIVERAEPLTETSRRSAGPARYVIELNGGEASRRGLRAGQRVRFVNIEGLP